MIIFMKDEEERKKLGRPEYILMYPTTNGFWYINACAHSQNELEEWASKNTDPNMCWTIAKVVQKQG